MRVAIAHARLRFVSHRRQKCDLLSIRQHRPVSVGGSFIGTVVVVSALERSRVWWINLRLLADTLGHVVENTSLVGGVYSGLRGLSSTEGCFVQRFSRELRVVGVEVVEGC